MAAHIVIAGTEMKIKAFLKTTDPILKLVVVAVLGMCIGLARDSQDVWLFFGFAVLVAGVAGVFGQCRRTIVRRVSVLIIPILTVGILTWLAPAARLWAPLDAVLRILALMLLGWTYAETTDARTLALSLARLPVPRGVYFTLLMATAIVPTIRAEAAYTAEAVKLKWGEVAAGGRPRDYPNLFVRSLLVFVIRMFMRADEMAEVAALRGLENPAGVRVAAAHQFSFREIAVSCVVIVFGLCAVVW